MASIHQICDQDAEYSLSTLFITVGGKRNNTKSAKTLSLKLVIGLCSKKNLRSSCSVYSWYIYTYLHIQFFIEYFFMGELHVDD